MNPIYTAFVYTVWFLATYFIVAFLLHAFSYRNRLYEGAEEDYLPRPKVSIVVPAYNEEAHINATIESLQKIDYPKNLLEVIIINDGSTDGTAKLAKQKGITLVDNKANKGKAACLNQGISMAKGEFIACMDADSQVSPDILKKTLPLFRQPKVGAVTVTVEVKERKSFLQKLIDLEFILGLSLFLRVFSFFNCIFVTPGPFSIYRGELLRQIKGFDEKNITEDLEIAYRIHKAGFSIENTMQTKVVTYAPPTFKKLYIQRRRWYSGAIITLWQHKGIVFNKNVGLFRYFIPFNYGLVLLGMGLSVYSIFLMMKNLAKSIIMHRHTGYDFFSNLSFNFDPYSISIFSFYGASAMLMTAIFVIVGLSLSKKSLHTRLVGFFAYLFIFLLYQFFWIASIASVTLGRKAKWR